MEGPPAADALHTRPCSEADRPEQAQLYNLCFEKSDGERVLRWRYDQNPHGRAVSLLTFTAEGRGVSGYACSPRRALAFGAEETSAIIGQTGDVMTDPEFRGRGIFSGLDRGALAETARESWPFVFGLPNRMSEKIFTGKLGWKAVGRIRPWTFVLRSDAAARAERMKAGRLAALATPWSLRLGAAARMRLRSIAGAELQVRPVERFEPAVDAISKTVETRFPFMVRRDHAYLNWRFCDAPSGLFKASSIHDAAGELAGYVVVQEPPAGGSTGYLTDVLARDDAAQAAAMEAGLAQLADAGLSVVRAWAPAGSWWENQLKSAGFRAAKAEDYKVIIAYVHATEHALGVAALDPSTWYFTDGDRDDEVQG